MKFFSQKDPEYAFMRLGSSNLIMSGHGCFVSSIATLYQVHPKDLLRVPSAFSSNGMLYSDVLARYCGGNARAPTVQPPIGGWCIAVTNDYSAAGYPTHFFCYNQDTKEMIDPLDFPSNPRPISYKIVQYRPFTNVKLDTSKKPPEQVFPDVESGRWSEGAIRKAKDVGLMNGYADGLFRPHSPVTREEIAVVLERISKKFGW